MLKPPPPQRYPLSEARAALQTETQARERACYQQFSVNACLSEVRAKRRATPFPTCGRIRPP